jgi:hypothetical protein
MCLPSRLVVDGDTRVGQRDRGGCTERCGVCEYAGAVRQIIDKPLGQFTEKRGRKLSALFLSLMTSQLFVDEVAGMSFDDEPDGLPRCQLESTLSAASDVNQEHGAGVHAANDGWAIDFQ